jgi:glycosyltransferase involved in cell wall biosynthesis
LRILFYTEISPLATIGVGGAETSISLMFEKMGQHPYVLCRYFSLSPRGKKSWTVRKFGFGKKLNITVFPNFRYKIHTIGVLNRLYRYVFKRVFHTRVKKFNPDIIYLHSHMPSLKIFESLGMLDKLVVRMASGNAQFNSIKKDIHSWTNTYGGIKAFNFLNGQNQSQFERFANEIGWSAFFNRPSFIGDIGVDTDSFKNNATQTVDNKKRIYVIGRLEGLPKRPELLLSAFDRAVNKYKIDLSMNFIGDGFQRKELEEKVKNSNVFGKVFFLGFVKRQDIPETISEANFIFLASDSEGVSKSILEALAMKKVVFASDIPENGFIEDGKTGFLIENTEDAWLMAFKKAAEMNENEIKEIGHNARQFILEKFDANKEARVILSEFKKLLN